MLAWLALGVMLPPPETAQVNTTPDWVGTEYASEPKHTAALPVMLAGCCANTGAVRVTLPVAVQPLSSVAVTVYAPAAKPVADRADAVQQLRLRARRRLIGAVLLVGIGVIGFPLLFETQPRPIPVDLPIEIPRKEGSLPLVVPPLMPALPPASAPAIVAAPPLASQPSLLPVEKPAAAAEPASAVAKKPLEAVVAESQKITPAKTVEKSPEKAPAVSNEALRAQAILDGRPVEKKASEPALRFVLQVGAFADAKAAQEVRLKLEKLGMKTYTQEIDTGEGRRVRVRVGPFSSRDEADKAAARLRAAGLSSSILKL